MEFWRGKWPSIIEWFVTMKCWVIVLYSKAQVSWNCSHDEQGIITIIVSFLDGILWRNCREIVSLEIRHGCYYFDLEYEICCLSKVSRKKRRNEIHWKKKWSVDFSWVWRKENCSMMRWTLVPIREGFYKPLWMNVGRRKLFWITLFENVSQLKWIILKEPFEDQKYLWTHFKYKIKITLG
jgi:hypothetical protein